MIGNRAWRRLGVLLLSGLAAGAAFAAGSKAVSQTVPKQPPHFVENKGQWDSRATFYSGMPGMDIWVTDSGLVYSLYRDEMRQKDWADNRLRNRLRPTPDIVRWGQNIGMTFVGGQTNPAETGVQPIKGVYNYIQGRNTVSGARRFNEVSMRGIYPGVDARLYFDQGVPRYDLIVAPGTDPNVIRTDFPGSNSVRVVSNDTLAIGTRFGDLRVTGLKVYQQIGNVKRSVVARFVKRGGFIGYEVGQYDRTKPLIIDPLVYSTLLGTIGDDQGWDCAADNLGFAYITGTTVAAAFPTTFGAFDEFIANRDAFVTKFTTDAVDLVYSTFIGGTGSETGTGIALDPQGNAYICGITNSDNSDPLPFPTGSAIVGVPPFQPNNAMGFNPKDANYRPTDAFVFKLNATGSAMVYGSYLGGQESQWQFNRPDPIVNPAASEQAFDIAVDSNGNAVVVGWTRSTSFPVTAGALEPVFDGPFQQPPNPFAPFGVNPGTDGFITKIDQDATTLVFSTYMGGRNNDDCTGVAIDPDGNIYATGTTLSTGGPLPDGSVPPGVFVTTPGAFDRTVINNDAWVLKLPTSGLSRTWATVVGGNDDDFGIDVDVDPFGDVYITGNTFSTNYPTTIAAFDRQYNNGADMFVTRIFRDGARLVYSTLCGSAPDQYPNALVVDDTGVAYIVGTSIFGGLATTTDGFDDTFEGPDPPFNDDLYIGDAFIQAYNDSGSNILYGSYIGGEEGDQAIGCALDPSRSLYIAGLTNSWREGSKVAFPTTTGAFREFMINDRPPPFFDPPKAWADAFLVKLHIRVPIVMESLTFVPRDVAGSQSSTGTIVLSGPASAGGALIHLKSSDPDVSQVPDTVLIPEGDTTVTFEATTNPVLETITTVIEATFEARKLQAPLVVAPYLSALTVSNINVIGGNSITGRVTLFQEAPAGGAEVALFSGDPNIVVMPESVTVPEGTRTAIFDIQTRGVAVLTQVQLTAMYLGMARSQIINVLPAQFRNFTFTPVRVTGGEKSRARITMSGAVPTSTVLQIVRVAGFTNVTFPSTVTIPANASFVEFDVQTGFVPASGTVRLRAIGPGGTIDGTLGIDTNQITGVIINPTSVIGGGTAVGRVNLSRPAAASGMVINLANNNPVAGALDRTTVLVPPGATTSEEFNIQTFSVTQTQTMVITASKPGYASRTGSLLVIEPTLGLQISLSPGTVVGGFGGIGIVEIVGPRVDDLIINLTSSNTTACQVPASVTIPAGQTEATFDFTTNIVKNDTSVTITARRGNQSASTTLLVTAPALASLTISPNSVRSNGTATGFLTLDQIAPAGGLTVRISANLPALVQIPSSINISGGRMTASFPIKANAVSRPIAVEIICQIQGRTQRVSAFLYINP
ncbi:MAG TPA: SBBP repeat-containing protein [Fimbriimonadaceae bacterium]|nr:SBBP repeat-containing protein [Fimbriimonadaceae bacterium]